MDSKIFVKSIKIAVAASLSIVIAGELQLSTPYSAGIITVLSIGPTKRETVASARNRGLAFLCALAVAAVCFGLMGFRLWGFAIYLFLFAMLCMVMGWKEAIATDSVLISHFLTAGAMTPVLLMNETLLLVIGAGMGILMNLHLLPQGAEFDRLADEVDRQIKEILERLAGRLRHEGVSGEAAERLYYEGVSGEAAEQLYYEGVSQEPAERLRQEECRNTDKDCFVNLTAALNAARDCAVTNHKNRFGRRDTYEMDYIAMRRQQANVLEGIAGNIQKLDFLPVQAGQVADLILEMRQDYHRHNNVEKLLDSMDRYLFQMKEEELPASREEFEARAILFYILLQLQNLMMIKREFMIRVG